MKNLCFAIVCILNCTGFILRNANQSAIKKTPGLPVAPALKNNPIHKHPTHLGIIFNDIDSSNYTSAGNIVATFKPAYIDITGGAGNLNTFTNYISYQWATALNEYVLKLQFMPVEDGAGLGIGFNNEFAIIDLSNTATRGQLVIKNNSTTLATSTTNLSFVTATDSILLSLKRDKQTLTYTATNLRTHKSVSVSYTFTLTITLPQTSLQARGKASIYTFGGNQHAARFSYHSSASAQTDFLLAGTSLTEGFYTGSLSSTYAEILEDNPHYIIQTEARQGDKISDMLSYLPEIKLRHTTYAIIELGTNEAPTTTAVSFYEQYKRLLDTLVACGIQPIIDKIIPNLASTAKRDSIKAYNKVIDTAWGNTGKFWVIDTYTPIYKNINCCLAADGTHMTAFGDELYANTIASFLSKKGFNITPVLLPFAALLPTGGFKTKSI